MKRIFSLIVFTLVFSSFAEISLDVEYKHTTDTRTIEFKDEVVTELDKFAKIEVPNSNTIIQIKLSDKIPNKLLGAKSDKAERLFVDMEVFEISNGKKHLIASPKVITLMGHEASFEVTEDSEDGQNLEVMTLNLIPRRL